MGRVGLDMVGLRSGGVWAGQGRAGRAGRRVLWGGVGRVG